MNSTGLHLVKSTDVRALASGLVTWLTELDADPFEAPLVLTPGAGMQRWLSQRIARETGAAGEGICAGVLFEPLSRLDEIVSGLDPADDPWAPQRLVWHVLALAEAHTPGLEPLRHHLAASDQRYANASRVASLLDRYARLRPDLLLRWSDADAVDDLGLGFDAWQAVLWRNLHSVVAGPDPVERRQGLIADLLAGRRQLDAPGVALFCPRALTAPTAELLAAVASERRISAWLHVAGPADSVNPLSKRLGTRGAETAALLQAQAASVVHLEARSRPGTLLGAVQQDLADGRVPRVRSGLGDDRTIDVRSSHGLDRQAEVLRDALAGLLADDPSLEPRDMVVACPDPALLTPYLQAVFTGDEQAHPAPGFRLKVAGGAQPNALHRLVREVTQLDTTRARAAQLLALAGQPFVARRFGFADDDTERLGALIEQAGIRWGLNAAHRGRFGIPDVRQGTWQVGVQRLLLGEALGDDEFAAAGVISPVDDVDSSDVELLGSLAELVSRLSRLVARPERATASGWVQHFRTIVEQLTDVGFEDSWQLAQFWSVLDVVERRSAGSPAVLGAADALDLLDAEFDGRAARPSFGDGSLVVCDLRALAQVPHRVVCLVGLDERTFPRRGLPDGDDLVAGSPIPGDPDPGRDDRQAVLDAICAAQDRLVVIYQGWSSHTLESRPAPAGVIELIEAATATADPQAEWLVRQEPLQPFSPSLFGPVPLSFDGAALRGARALTAPRRRRVTGRFDGGHLPLSEPVTTLDLDQLRSFLQHPARSFLRERAGLTIGDEEAASEELPIELDALARWQIGDRLLGQLIQGRPLETARHAERLRGALPPGELGTRLLDDVSRTAVTTAGDAEPYLATAPRFVALDETFEGVRVTGRVAVRGDVALTASFSRVSPRTIVSAWVDLLAATVVTEQPVDAVLLGGGRRRRLTAPGPDAARESLAELVALAVHGRERILPLPPRVGRLWAESRARNGDPLADRDLNKQWSWDRDAVWDAVLPSGRKPWDEPASGSPWSRAGEKSLLGSLAAVVWRPIVRAER